MIVHMQKLLVGQSDPSMRFCGHCGTFLDPQAPGTPAQSGHQGASPLHHSSLRHSRRGHVGSPVVETPRQIYSPPPHAYSRRNMEGSSGGQEVVAQIPMSGTRPVRVNGSSPSPLGFSGSSVPAPHFLPPGQAAVRQPVVAPPGQFPGQFPPPVNMAGPGGQVAGPGGQAAVGQFAPPVNVAGPGGQAAHIWGHGQAPAQGHALQVYGRAPSREGLFTAMIAYQQAETARVTRQLAAAEQQQNVQNFFLSCLYGHPGQPGQPGAGPY